MLFWLLTNRARGPFKTQQFYSTKKFISHKKNCLFSSSFKSLQLFWIKRTFTFSIFPLYQPAINIAHNARGYYGKYGPKYWPSRARLIYLQALAMSIILFTALYKSALTFYSVNKILSVTIQIRVLKNAFLWLVFAMLYKVSLWIKFRGFSNPGGSNFSDYGWNAKYGH